MEMWKRLHFNATYSAIKYYNVWCQLCSKSISNGEAITKATLEQIFGVAFPRERPNWLKMETHPLELDGVNHQLKLAFEYNGRQHYLPLGLATKRRRKRH